MDDLGATILVVEDHEPTRMFLADNLCADGYEPIGADCAHDARLLLATRYPDLVIVDLGLPDGDGLDLVREIRAGDRRRQPPRPRAPGARALGPGRRARSPARL